MTELETFAAILGREHRNIERLAIYDGDTELSISLMDHLTMHRVEVKFHFSVKGDLRWIDAEVKN